MVTYSGKLNPLLFEDKKQEQGNSYSRFMANHKAINILTNKIALPILVGGAVAGATILGGIGATALGAGQTVAGAIGTATGGVVSGIGTGAMGDINQGIADAYDASQFNPAEYLEEQGAYTGESMNLGGQKLMKEFKRKISNLPPHLRAEATARLRGAI